MVLEAMIEGPFFGWGQGRPGLDPRAVPLNQVGFRANAAVSLGMRLSAHRLVRVLASFNTGNTSLGNRETVMHLTHGMRDAGAGCSRCIECIGMVHVHRRPLEA